MLSIHKSSPEADGVPAVPLVAEVCMDLKIAAPSQDAVYRYLGYRQGAVPAPQVASGIEQIVSEARLCVEPRGAFALYEITDRTADSLAFGDDVIAGNVAEFLGTADRVAVFVVTIGDAVSKLAAKARQRDDALSEWIIDAFGSWAAEAAADALMERIRRHVAEDEALTLRYSPGYCGMAMEQQQTLFRMVQAEAIGVKLLPSMLMYPLKSISGIVGVGPKDKVSTYRAPCDRCDRAGCHMRR